MWILEQVYLLINGTLNFVINKITSDEERKIKSYLSEVKGMLDITKKDKEISGNLKNVVSQDNSMKIIQSKIAELLNSNALPDSKRLASPRVISK